MSKTAEDRVARKEVAIELKQEVKCVTNMNYILPPDAPQTLEKAIQGFNVKSKSPRLSSAPSFDCQV